MPISNEVDQGPSTDPTTQWDRRWFVLSLVAAAAPVLFAAIRDGLTGWTPTYDTALTITRVRDVFGAHPPLVGMWSAGSTWSAHAIYFPGALGLYLLAIPVQLFGYRWGPLLGMAALNIAWIVIAGWLLFRRLGARSATLGCAFIALLVWSLGSELVVAAEPVHMLLLPSMAFLIAVWAVADGDIIAIPVLALIANFLVLNHLVLTQFVPMVGLCAPMGLALVLRRKRSTDSQGWPVLRRRTLTQLARAAVLTVVLWVPSLYQEFTTHPGNLTNLLHSASADRPDQASYSAAVSAIGSMLTVPPFWFRGSFASPPFSHPLHTLELVLGLGAIVVVIVLAVLAHRRGDRSVLTMLAVFAAATAAAIQNFVSAPGLLFAVRPMYHRVLWPLAMMGWMTVAIAIYRALPQLRPRRLVTPGLAFAGVAVVAALCTFPYANQGAITTKASTRVAREMVSEVIPQLPGKGTVRIAATYSVQASYLAPALALALDDRAIPYCIDDVSARQYGDEHHCGDKKPGDTSLMLYGPIDKVPSDAHIIADIDTTPAGQAREFARLQARLERWLATTPTLEISPALRPLFLKALGPDHTKKAQAVLADTPRDERASLVHDDSFVYLVSVCKLLVEKRKSLGATEPLPQDLTVFVNGELGYKDLFRWFDLRIADREEQIVVTMS